LICKYLSYKNHTKINLLIEKFTQTAKIQPSDNQKEKKERKKKTFQLSDRYQDSDLASAYRRQVQIIEFYNEVLC